MIETSNISSVSLFLQWIVSLTDFYVSQKRFFFRGFGLALDPTLDNTAQRELPLRLLPLFKKIIDRFYGYD